MPPKPRVLTEEELAQVEALASVLTTEQIADYFGIGRTTFYEIMDRQEGVSERYKRGRVKAIGTVGRNLVKKAMSGDNASAIFYLKTQAGWRESTHVDHTSSDGSMSPTDMSDEERKARIEALMKKKKPTKTKAVAKKKNDSDQK